MAVQYAPMKLRVPPGFQNLLEGLAREVLREQPEDIIVFAAQYFKNQLQIRDETGKDDAKKGDQMDRLQKGEDVDIDLKDPEVQAAATKIQASFRGHKAREDVKKQKDEEAAAIKIQASFRGHQARERVKEIKISQSREMVSESVTAVKADTVGDDSAALPEEARKLEEEMSIEPEKQEATIDAKPRDADGANVEGVPAKPEVEGETEVPVRQETEEDTTVVTDGGEVAGNVQVEEAGESAEQKAEDAVEAGDGAEAEGGEAEGEAEQIDLDMNDPELHNAAVRIQASFRGHKAREGVKAVRSSDSVPLSDRGETSEEKQDETEGDKDGDKDGESQVPEGAKDPKPSED